MSDPKTDAADFLAQHIAGLAMLAERAGLGTVSFVLRMAELAAWEAAGNDGHPEGAPPSADAADRRG